ncbi:uncharacterized protein LOC144578542 [Callithrix jacchus]
MVAAAEPGVVPQHLLEAASTDGKPGSQQELASHTGRRAVIADPVLAVCPSIRPLTPGRPAAPSPFAPTSKVSKSCRFSPPKDLLGSVPFSHPCCHEAVQSPKLSAPSTPPQTITGQRLPARRSSEHNLPSPSGAPVRSLPPVSGPAPLRRHPLPCPSQRRRHLWALPAGTPHPQLNEASALRRSHAPCCRREARAEPSPLPENLGPCCYPVTRTVPLGSPRQGHHPQTPPCAPHLLPSNSSLLLPTLPSCRAHPAELHLRGGRVHAGTPNATGRSGARERTPGPGPSLRAASTLRVPTSRQAKPQSPRAFLVRLPRRRRRAAGPGAQRPVSGAGGGLGGPRAPAQGKGLGTAALTPSAPDDEPRSSRGPTSLSRLPLCPLQQACNRPGQSQTPPAGTHRRRGDTASAPTRLTHAALTL